MNEHSSKKLSFVLFQFHTSFITSFVLYSFVLKEKIMEIKKQIGEMDNNFVKVMIKRL